MKFTINIKKLHFIIILALIVLIGFVIAQTPNPGHTDGEVWLNNMGQSMTAWSTSVETKFTNVQTSITTINNAISLFYAGINCPLGMFEVGASPGIRGSYCISSIPVGTSNWAQAVQQCTGSGQYLCSTAELVGACGYAGYSSSTQFGWGTAHWAADLDTGFSALVVGAGSCTTINAGNLASVNYQHRCCKNLIGNN